MPLINLYNNDNHIIDEVTNTEVLITFDLGTVLNLKFMTLKCWVETLSAPRWCFYKGYYSFDNITWFLVINTISDTAPLERTLFNGNLDATTSKVYVKFEFTSSPYSNIAVNLFDLTLSVYDLIPEALDFTQELKLSVAEPWQGYKILDDNLYFVFPHIITQVEGGGVDPTPEDPTSTNIVSGNISKLGLPFKANVTMFSIGNNSEVVGQGESDPLTGDYAIDIYPHTGEVLIFVAPDYGRAFAPELLLTTGDIVHPLIPDKNVYEALNNGKMGSTEPDWNNVGDVISGEVTLKRIPLFAPLANGFIKPVITPIP